MATLNILQSHFQDFKNQKLKFCHSAFFFLLSCFNPDPQISRNKKENFHEKRHLLEWAAGSFPLLGPNPIPLLELYFLSFDNIEL